MRRGLSVGCILLAVGVASYGWWRVTRHDWTTGANDFEWYDAAGESRGANDTIGATGRWIGDSCHLYALDEALVIGDQVLARCAHGLVELDPQARTARMGWPEPDYELSELIGVAPKPGSPDILALALTVHIGPDSIPARAVGVIDRTGWRMPLRIATQDVESFPLAFAWRGEALELVTAEKWGHGATLIHVEGAAIPTITELPVSCDYCQVLGAYRDADDEWTAVVQDHRGYRLVTRHGSVAAPPTLDRQWHDIGSRYTVDRAAYGVVAMAMSSTHIARLDGTLAPIPEAPLPDLGLTSARRYDVIGSTIVKRYQWRRAYTSFQVERVGDRVIAYNAGDDASTIGDLVHPVITRVTETDLSQGMLFPTATGYTWFAGSGAYVTLDENLVRTDPLPVHEHLRRRGSRGNQINEARHFQWLALALGGLPIALALALVTSFLVDRKRLRLSLVGGFSAAYAVAALVGLHHVVPLLGGWT